MAYRTFTASGTTEITVEVPPPFKILAGGATLNGLALLTGSFPVSATKWMCTAVPLHRDADVTVTVLAVEDTENVLNIEVVQQTGKGSVLVQCPQGKVGLCGGGKCVSSCLTISSVYDNGSGWMVAAEIPSDPVTSSYLVATQKDDMKIVVDANRRGTWRVYMDSFGEGVIYMGASRCQNVVAQSTVLTPPNQYSVTHPWKATPRLWRMSRSTLPSENLTQLTKDYCTVTKKSPRGSVKSTVK
eukprot:PhF_6_TR19614/c0_g1_i1/m.28621